MTSDKDLVSNHVRKLIKQLTGKNSYDKLFMLACTIELLRRAQQIDSKNVRALVDFMSRVYDVPWKDIPFSVTQKTLVGGAPIAVEYGAKAENVNDILMEALASFSDIVADVNENHDAEAIFNAVIAEATEASNAPPAVPKAVQAAEIFTESMLTRIFKPAVFTDKLAEQIGATPVVFRGLLRDIPGPSLRGLAFDNGMNTWHVILESGEFVRCDKSDEAITIATTAHAYASMPISLLAYTSLAVLQLEWLGILNESQAAAIRANGLGELVGRVNIEFVAKENAVLLENVIDIKRESLTLGGAGATGAVGASVRYAVPGVTQREVVIDAKPSSSGPYAVARLVEKQTDGSETVLMRLDYPRQFSARGVYVFPVANLPVSLNVIY